MPSSSRPPALHSAAPAAPAPVAPGRAARRPHGGPSASAPARPGPVPGAASPEVISFKADQDLVALLKGVPNRSAFIRNAVLAALDKSCPLCHGSGMLPPHLHTTWERLASSHPLSECGTCHERVFTCSGKPLQHACTV
jgi:hypothetical protein